MPARGRDHLVVVQLDLLLIDLRIQRVQLRLRGIESRARLVEILPADHTGIRQAADAVVILLRPFELRQSCAAARILLALHCGLLLGGIDLHQGRAVGDMLAGVHENLGNDAFDLGHDHGRVARFQSRDVFGACRRSFSSLRRLHFDRHGLRSGGLGFFVAAAGGGQEQQAEKAPGRIANGIPAKKRRWRFCEESRHIVSCVTPFSLIALQAATPFGQSRWNRAPPMQ